MGYNFIGFLLLSFLALIAARAMGNRPGRWYPAKLLLAAVALRIVGSTARYEILFRFYDGLGDAVRYYHEGLDVARLILDGRVSPFSLDFWGGPHWWGTAFLIKASGVVLTFLGSTMRGEFLLFSLLAFGGLYAMARAFHNLQPGPQAVQYATWIWLWPSLWFWPSSVGKEALIVLALGLATLGYVGRGRGIIWPLYLAGLGLAFSIRPHVAAVIALATVIAYWLGSWQRLSVRRLGEAALATGLALFAFAGMKAQFGLADADLEGVREFVEFHAGQTLQGGSNLGAAPLAAGGLPLAFINVWMRPFPWEAHNLTAAFAAVEIMVFWWLIWQRRKGLRLALRHWRRHRLLRFALPMLLVYTLMIGLAFGNLGIIARQRAPMFPFMFMILVAIPAPVPKRRAALRSGGRQAFPQPRGSAPKGLTERPGVGPIRP